MDVDWLRARAIKHHVHRIDKSSAAALSKSKNLRRMHHSMTSTGCSSCCCALSSAPMCLSRLRCQHFIPQIVQLHALHEQHLHVHAPGVGFPSQRHELKGLSAHEGFPVLSSEVRSTFHGISAAARISDSVFVRGLERVIASAEAAKLGAMVGTVLFPAPSTPGPRVLKGTPGSPASGASAMQQGSKVAASLS